MSGLLGQLMTLLLVFRYHLGQEHKLAVWSLNQVIIQTMQGMLSNPDAGVGNPWWICHTPCMNACVHISRWHLEPNNYAWLVGWTMSVAVVCRCIIPVIGLVHPNHMRTLWHSDKGAAMELGCIRVLWCVMVGNAIRHYVTPRVRQIGTFGCQGWYECGWPGTSGELLPGEAMRLSIPVPGYTFEPWCGRPPFGIECKIVVLRNMSSVDIWARESASSNAVGVGVLDLCEAMTVLQKSQIEYRSFYWPLGGLK